MNNALVDANMLTRVYDSLIPASDNCRIGFFDYDDNATATTPLAVTGGAGFVQVPNNALGAQTLRTFAPNGVTDVWNGTTGQFDFSQLRNGDMLDIRTTLFITTTAPNQSFEFNLNLAIGGFAYTIPFSSGSIKSTGLHKITRFNGLYIGDDNTRLNPAEFVISSSDDASIEVGGWYCKVLMRG